MKVIKSPLGFWCVSVQSLPLRIQEFIYTNKTKHDSIIHRDENGNEIGELSICWTGRWFYYELVGEKRDMSLFR